MQCRVGIDEWLRVPSVDDVFALGDCAGFLEQTGKQVLPALAQVAEREGKYLAQLLKRVARQNGGKAHCAKKADLGEPFVYKHIGSMASVGRYKALVDLRENKVVLPLVGLQLTTSGTANDWFLISKQMQHKLNSESLTVLFFFFF